MRKCRCGTCGEKFNSVKEKLAHKKKYPNKSCRDPISKLDIGKIHRNNYKEVKKMFGRKKKKKVEAEKETEVPNAEEDDDEIPEIMDEEEDEDYEQEEEEKPKKKVKEVKRQQDSDEELTEEKVKEILINHEARLKRIEYHLRI